jgi:rare lipoprotein A
MHRIILFIFLAVSLFSCRQEKGPEPYTTTGEASFYGRGFHGQKSADGGIFHKDSLTAAHLYLPFGTVVKVDNLETGRSVEVTITDRGPYSGDRILDLSRAAADSLGMVDDGTARVKITVLKAADGYTVADSVANDRVDKMTE